MREMKGNMEELQKIYLKEGEKIKIELNEEKKEKILLLKKGGKLLKIGEKKMKGGRGKGEKIRIMVDMEKDKDIMKELVKDK